MKLYLLFLSSINRKYDFFFELNFYFCFVVIMSLIFTYNLSLILYLNKLNKFLRSKITKMFEYFFMKRNSDYYVNFLTTDIEQQVLLFYFLFNFIILLLKLFIF